MLHIDPYSSKIKKALDLHVSLLIPLLKIRISKIVDPDSILFIDRYITPNLKRILSDKPKNLIVYSRAFSKYNNEQLLKDINSIFNYRWFIDKIKSRYSGYDLAKNLDINSCTYCNRNYTNTVITKNGDYISRPQFDHYFDKKSHPLLSLSFFNLIPSCSICNSNIKHTKVFKLSTHSHPYIDDICDEFKFSYSLVSDPFYKNGLKIDVRTKLPKIEKYLSDLAISEVYNSHTDILFDLIETKKAFTNSYIQILEENVLNQKISNEEIYRFAFGVYLDDKDFDKRPLSKFKKDILTELGFI